MAAQGMSALELAMISGNSPTTVLRLRQGKHSLLVSTLADVAGALGCRVVITLEREQEQ